MTESLPRTDVLSFLRGLAGPDPVFYKPNPGNAGDSLIACATFQLFKKAGIQYQLIDDGAFDPSGKTVLYGGGGNLVEGRLEARRFIERCHESAARLVLLPHTVSGHEDLLGRMGPTVDLFLREEVSLEHVEHAAPRANHFLADDLAFSLDSEGLLQESVTRPVAGIRFKQLVRRERMLSREALCRRCGKKTLTCFRTDKEKTGRSGGWLNADLSKLFKCGTDTEEQAAASSRMLLSFLNRYDEVRTNRLHVAVAGALLGKAVLFYPNSYFKCEAVYRYSMVDRFPTVRWMG